HSGYNVLEMINNELNEDASVHKSSSDLDSSDDDYDPLDDLTYLVDFQTEGDDNLDIPKITTDDPWLNKLILHGINATKDAEQEAMRKIWEEQMYENDWPGVEYVSFSDSDENGRYNTPTTGIINDFDIFDEPPPATPSNPTPSNPTSTNLNPSNPTSAKPTSVKPTSAKPTPRTRSKRKQLVNPAVPRVFVKQRGRSEM
ncbi:hypothetical protein Tco_0113656, partial [Tanacetum coccineum]